MGHYRWEVVGQAPAEIGMGKGSGLDSVKIWLEQAGIQTSEEEAHLVLAAVKEFSLARKRLLAEEEFQTLANSTIAASAAKQ